jgi:hypothetical protein
MLVLLLAAVRGGTAKGEMRETSKDKRHVNRDKRRGEMLKNRETSYERHKPRAPETRKRKGRQGRETRNPC